MFRIGKHPIGNRYMAGLYESRCIPVGAKIWFDNEKQGYTVRASNAAFCVLTKPFNAQKTVLYCIIDWESGVRGPENLVFGMGAETDEDCQEMLERMTTGESEVSSRNYRDITIVKYYNPQLKKTYTEVTTAASPDHELSDTSKNAPGASNQVEGEGR